MPETYFITGANRGIGLGLTQVFLGQGDRVFAACRDPHHASDLQELKKKYGAALEIIPLEVTSDDSIQAAVRETAGKTGHLDGLLNNAGVSLESPGTLSIGVDLEKFRTVLEVNTLSPLNITRSFLPLLQKSKNPRVLNMSSNLGSISAKTGSGYYAYSVSKAALNMLTRILAAEFQSIIIVAVHPGWVKTDMGGPGAPVTPLETSAHMVKMFKELTFNRSGLFLDNQGRELTW